VEKRPMACRKKRPETTAAVFVAAYLSLFGCSPSVRHEVLTFLFDGVPQPGMEEETEQEISPQYFGKPREGVAIRRPKMLFHRPYREHQCDRCHPKERSLYLGEGFDRRGLCFTCHEHAALKTTLESLPFHHGPVAARNCLACHDAHESIYQKLLAAPDPDLCYRCHEPESIVASGSHGEWTDGTCLPCHDPHGGSDRFFLRKDKKS
jgi:predicted CXXCH cytochrome family protein